MGYEGVWIIRDDFGTKTHFGSSEKVWVMREYGLWEKYGLWELWLYYVFNVYTLLGEVGQRKRGMNEALYLFVSI